MNNRENAKLLKNALTVAVGGFFAKLLGAVYRIPLGNLLGGYGLGLYQMVFPVYAMLLTFSGSGVPSALSKLIAESGEREVVKLMRASKTLWLFGLIFSVLLAAFSLPLARLQGNAQAGYAYLFLSPSVFFVSAFSAYRGYFQGKENMLPTVFSQIVEQGAKLVLGLVFAFAFISDISMAAGGACLGVTCSEGIAYLYLRGKYKKSAGKAQAVFLPGEKRTYIKRILAHVFPMTLIGILPPLTGVIIGFFTIPLLSQTTPFATRQYGVYFGGVTAVVAMPVALCYGIAVAVIPLLSKGKGRMPDAAHGNKEKAAYLYTLLLALPASVAVYVFRREITAILFPSLSAVERVLAAKLLGVSSASVLFLSVGQTASAVLIAKGRAVRSAKNYAVGCAVTLFFSFALLKGGYGIISLPISANFGDFVATFLNLVYSRRKQEKRAQEMLVVLALVLLALLSGMLGSAVGVGGPLLRVFTGGGAMLAAYLIAVGAGLFVTRLRKKGETKG